jgi:hypothetical protein
MKIDVFVLCVNMVALQKSYRCFKKYFIIMNNLLQAFNIFQKKLVFVFEEVISALTRPFYIGMRALIKGSL